ncbi:hypothetical protein Hc94105_0021 [Helicobacter cinaedi]|uniref:hypothetical protein n=1 Tax=Helicobacter cinaedi TaxID=213 RepID=UPI001F3040F2|nr:hypothetical protein [Helicobacter cinaedi]BDB65842.1 hypothetical protein Hc94105_0021 [Helicobacter cinaedi]
MKKSITLDVFNEYGASLGKKRFYTKNISKKINDWYSAYYDKNANIVGIMNTRGNDFQNQNYIRITSTNNYNHTNTITPNNLIPTSIYLSVRHCIKATWINDRDQFLAPNKKWEKDTEFHSDCLIFMLFHGQNRITSKVGINHFIPFSEKDIDAAEAFDSHFMQDFLQGKIKQDSKSTDSKSLFNDELESTFIPTKPLEFSDEAKEVLQAGKEIFKHYHTQAKDSKDYNPNAALYDIKAHFQGFNDKGKMNPPQKAQDEAYKEILGTLNYALKNLAKKIEVKVYEYGFLLP